MIAKALKKIRKEHKLTQTQLAKETELSQQAISNWENRKRVPNIEECIKLADFYEITLDELLDRD